MKNKAVGLGDINAELVFYIKNRPPLTTYENLNSIKAIIPGEIAYICQETGNHWRKIFNVYAKLLFELAPKHFSSWQDLREQSLLQVQSEHCLLFSAPNLPTVISREPDDATIKPYTKLHIILGKGYAEQLGLCQNFTWLSNDFAVNRQQGIIICPYFDYRQLSNKKITQLIGLIKQLI